MTRLSVLSIAGLAVAGSLGAGITGASAQTIYFEPYVEPGARGTGQRLCRARRSLHHRSCASAPAQLRRVQAAI